MKKYLTMWQVWATVSIALTVILLIGTSGFANFLPFALILICPIMMVFMMGGHKHK